MHQTDTEMCIHAKKIHSNSGYDFQITLQSTVKCYPTNSEVSKARLQKQLLKGAVLSCLGRVGQTNVLPRRREDVGRNSQVKAEAEVVSERVKVFYHRKEKQSRWEKSTCYVMTRHRGTK